MPSAGSPSVALPYSGALPLAGRRKFAALTGWREHPTPSVPPPRRAGTRARRSRRQVGAPSRWWRGLGDHGCGRDGRPAPGQILEPGCRARGNRHLAGQGGDPRRPPSRSDASVTVEIHRSRFQPEHPILVGLPSRRTTSSFGEHHPCAADGTAAVGTSPQDRRRRQAIRSRSGSMVAAMILSICVAVAGQVVAVTGAAARSRPWPTCRWSRCPSRRRCWPVT